MKQMKMLGLAAIGALGLMAFVGAGTASATTLATDSAGTVKYGVGTEIHSTLKSNSSTSLKDTSGNTIATCTGSTTKGFIGNAWETWVAGAISVLTWEGCSQTTTTLATGSIDIMQTNGDAGTVVSRGGEVTLNVFGVNCVYGTGEGTTLGTITGGSAPELSINTGLLKTTGGFLCPISAVWTAQYIITSPHALHIVS